MICGHVDKQHLTIKHDKVVSDSINYVTAHFDFVGWDNFVKVAHFRKGDTTYSIILTNDEIRESDHLNLTAGVWEVFLHGDYDDRRVTTDVQRLTVYRSGCGADGNPLPDMPLPVAEQILQKVTEAQQIAQGLQDAAERGDFDGKDYNHSAEFERLSQEMAGYQQQVAQDRQQIADSVETAQNAASDAAKYAELAEQSAASDGYVFFDIDAAGHLIETKSENVDSAISFNLNSAGRLEVSYE